MLIDVSMPIVPGAVFRLGSPPVELFAGKFHHESEGQYETVILTMPVHTATHIDLVLKERRISPERMIGPGRMIDVTGVQSSRIGLDDIVDRPAVAKGDFVFFRTGWSQHAGTVKYYDHPELAFDVVEWLASLQVNAVGIDAPGLGQGRLHGEMDRFLAQSDVLVIENLTNLHEVPTDEFDVYCFPLSIEGVDAIPARVVADVRG